jgi:hypothetical protein
MDWCYVVHRFMEITSTLAAARSQLPQSARWLVDGTPQDFSFYSNARSLDVVMTEQACGGVLQHASDFIVFGEYDFAEGGGAKPWLVVRCSDGKVFGVDVEREASMFSLNSSLDAFINTFCLLDKFLRRHQQIPEDLEMLVQSLDPAAYDGSEWRDLVAHMKMSQ